MNLFHRTQRTHQSSASASRLRRQRRQRPALESLEGRQLLTATAQFQVNSTQGAADFNSDTASSPSGTRVVVWEDIYAPNPKDHDIHAQMYNPDGSRRGGQITVEGNNLLQFNPRVAMDASGDFAVVWEENQSDIGGSAQNYIMARAFDSNGNALTGRIAVSKDNFTGRSDIAPDVAMDARGDFTVVWESLAPGPQSTIGAAEYDIYGDFLVTPFVNTAGGHFQQDPSVAMTPDGRIDIAFVDSPFFDPQAQGYGDLRLDRFDDFGNRLSDGDIFTGTGSDAVTTPQISVDNSGNAVIAYQTVNFGGIDAGIYNQPDISVVRLDSAADFLGGFSITSTGIDEGVKPVFASTNPDIALDPNGTGMFVVAFDTQQLGSPSQRTVQVDEFNLTSGISYVYNVPAFPNNGSPAVSLDANGGYQMTYTANIGRGSPPEQVWTTLGQLPISPAAKNLALTPTIQLGQSAVLTGSLTDASGDTNLTLTVNWGDGSKPDQSKPGLNPFDVTHKYTVAGTYKVHATWTDDHGLSRSRDLYITVNAHK